MNRGGNDEIEDIIHYFSDANMIFWIMRTYAMYDIHCYLVDPRILYHLHSDPLSWSYRPLYIYIYPS